MTPIQTKLAQLQAAGWHITDVPIEVPLPDGGATMLLPLSGAALFQAPGASVAYEVHGAILAAYTAQGGPAIALGYPQSDELPWYDSVSRLSEFAGGVITWSPATNATVHWNKVVSHLGQAARKAFELLGMPTAAASARVHAQESVGAGVNWCGYALLNIMKSAGLDSQWKELFASTQGLLDFGSYYTLDIYGAQKPRTKVTKVLPGGQDIRQIHQQRLSPRGVILWQELQAGTPLDIVPGDIVLVDHNEGGGPDHIQIVYRWHPNERVLTTIDGNGGSFVLRSVMQNSFAGAALLPGVHYRNTSATPEAGSGVSTLQKQTYLQTLDGLDVAWPLPQAGYVSVGCHVLTAAGQVNPPTPTSHAPHSRVFAVVRPSLVDFEVHGYEAL